ncbi:MAG: hypothetical protein C0604_06490 [Clostridiales bacterium]|nr:MAG: hypothetical protein C0604_06490 [Clostridiales bacterium]
MQNILKELEAGSLDRPKRLKAAKKEGKKIIEYIGNFVPEEMIYAAGAEPYLMCRGGEPEPPDAVLEYMLRFMNPYARSLAGYHMLGLDPVTPVADLIVAQQLDCHIGRISEVMEYMELPIYKVGVPPDWKKDYTFDYYHKALLKLKDKLEKETGNEITEDKLLEEVKASNAINERLRKIDALRENTECPIGGTDFIKLNHYSFFNDTEYMVEALDKLIEKLETEEPKFAKGTPRILFAGHIVAVGDYVVPRLIEENGGFIAADFLDEGIRWYNWDVPVEGDIIKNIAETKFLVKTPVTLFQPAWRERVDYVMKLVEEKKIDAVVWYQLAFDEIYDMECTILAKNLGEAGIPFLKLESSYEYSREAMGPLRTRIESFIEAVKEAK